MFFFFNMLRIWIQTKIKYILSLMQNNVKWIQLYSCHSVVCLTLFFAEWQRTQIIYFLESDNLNLKEACSSVESVSGKQWLQVGNGSEPLGLTTNGLEKQIWRQLMWLNQDYRQGADSDTTSDVYADWSHWTIVQSLQLEGTGPSVVQGSEYFYIYSVHQLRICCAFCRNTWLYVHEKAGQNLYQRR